MKNKIIKLAIGLPQAYPWKREITEFSTDELDRILEEFDLKDIDKRRVAAWEIEITAYRAMIEVNIASREDFEEYILKTLKNRSYISNDSIDTVLRRKRLFYENEIALFKKFINNTLSVEEKIKNNVNILYWSVDLLTYYKLSQENSNYSSKQLEKDIENFLANNFNESKIASNKINEAQHKRGYTNNSATNLFSSNFNQTNDFKNILKNFKLEEVKSDDIPEAKSLQDSIMDIFKAANINSDTSELKIESESISEICNDDNATPQIAKTEIKILNEYKNLKETKEELEDKEKLTKVLNQRLEEHLSGLCEELGYKIAKEDEVILSKEKYKKIMEVDEDKEIKLLKELVSMKNGAILSKLYNTYKNIDSVSKDNIEAVLNNLFNTLSSLGCEVENEVNKIGDRVKVNTNNVLKEFIFTRPVNCDGEIEGIIEYYGWSYKGRKIAPIIIKPNK